MMATLSHVNACSVREDRQRLHVDHVLCTCPTRTRSVVQVPRSLCVCALSYLPLPLPFPLPCTVLDEPLPVPLPELPFILPSADVPLLGLPPIAISLTSCRSCYNARLMHTRSCRAAHPSRQVGHVLPCAVAPTVDDAIPPSI